MKTVKSLVVAVMIGLMLSAQVFAGNVSDGDGDQVASTNGVVTSADSAPQSDHTLAMSVWMAAFAIVAAIPTGGGSTVVISYPAVVGSVAAFIASFQE